jgi:hypothetical protein
MTKPTKPSDDSIDLTSLQDAVHLAISGLAGHFIDHPGFMWTRSGFKVLHAKWPAYPIGEGRRAALCILAEYPAGIKFFNADQIDRCTLFSVGSQRHPDKSVPEHLFLAIWDDDLRELSKAGLIEGVSGVEDEFLWLPNGYIALTPKRSHVALTYELTAAVHPKILNRVDEFLEIDRCDAAVREASILLEQAIGILVGDVAKRGKELIDQMFD